MTAKNSVKPKSALVQMTDPERLALGLALAAVIAIHATASVWSVRQLFYG